METDKIRDEIKNLLLYSIRKSNEYNNKYAIESVFNMLRNILLRDLDDHRFLDFKSNIFLLHFFLRETENNRELNSQVIKKSLILFNELLIVLFNLRSKTKSEYKEAYKSFADSYTLFMKNQISENKIADFLAFYDLVASTPYLFPETTFHFQNHKGIIEFKVSYSYVIIISIQSWLWHLYKTKTINISHLLRFQKIINSNPVDFRILLHILSITNTDEMLNWTMWDNLQTERFLEDWIIFGITIFLIASNFHKYKIKEDEEFIFKLFTDSLISNSKQILENLSRWETSFGEIENIKKYDLDLTIAEIEQVKSFYEKSRLFSVLRFDLKNKCERFINYLEKLSV